MGKTKLGITRFFTGLLKNIHKLVFTNILFAVPLIIFGGGIYCINSLTNLNSTLLYFLPIIFVFPFFSGVTLITRNIVKEEENISVLKLFLKGLKENFWKFLFHGVFLYFTIFFCYTSITLYWSLAFENGIFFVLFAISVVITVVLLIMFFNIPVMTVTFDLSLKDIYKNAFLMTFGELKNNFFAALGLFLLFIFCCSLFFTATSELMLIIIVLILAVLIVPSVASYIVNFYVYKGIESIIVNKQKKSEEIKEKIQLEKEKKNQEVIKEILDFSNLDLNENKDGEEYLYFNGKMIKRRVLIEMKKQQEQNNE